MFKVTFHVELFITFIVFMLYATSMVLCVNGDINSLFYQYETPTGVLVENNNYLYNKECLR